MTSLIIQATQDAALTRVYAIIEKLKLFNSCRIILNYCGKNPSRIQPCVHGIYFADQELEYISALQLSKLILTCTEYSITPIFATEASIRPIADFEEMEQVTGTKLKFQDKKPWQQKFCLANLSQFDRSIVSSLYMTHYEEFDQLQLCREIRITDSGVYCLGSRIANLEDPPTKWLWYTTPAIDRQYNKLEKISENREFINSSVYTMSDFLLYEVSDAKQVIAYKQTLLNTLLNLDANSLAECDWDVYNLMVSNGYIPLSKIHEILDPYLSIGG